MNTNYYETLEIQRDSTSEQITHAFKRLSMKYNPIKNPANQASNQQKFGQICEAYDVLSNPERKAIFDLYGEYGLKNGVTNHLGEKIGGYIYLGNDDQIFEKVFTSSHPFLDDFELDGTDMYGGILGDGHRAKNQPRPDPPKDVELLL